MYRNRVYLLCDLLFFLGVIVTNSLAQIIPLGGMNTGEISDMYHTLITPSGYAFTIWLFIYALLAGFIVYQFRRVGTTGTNASYPHLHVWFMLSCLFNIAWILLWQYKYITLSLVAMILLLISLAILYVNTQKIVLLTKIERCFIILPFSLYFGWICVATLVNIHVVLFQTGIGDKLNFNETITAIIMLVVGVLAAFLISFHFLDGVPPLVFVWAYIAIAIEQRWHPKVYLTAGTLSVMLFVYALWIIFMRATERD
ncbi:tryptophan-rich sensory protein [Paenibacillus segetis]|uniref:Tryptophan-rich sensory protein n=1 Tax=Paenibacillus segetis TaxID=1325360 RepID=A0ABQ1YTB2_9BACL|nr:tryptophan-rich sensory protein [Paenibacillus segetis]GGH38012.1 tryptophan-rich sensory protein [Paenibacillus segetis]